MQCGRPNEAAYGTEMLRLRDADEEETTNCCLFNYVSQSGWLQRRRRGRGRATSLCKTAPCNQDDNNWTGPVLPILLVEGSTVSGLKQGSEGENARTWGLICIKVETKPKCSRGGAADLLPSLAVGYPVPVMTEGDGDGCGHEVAIAEVRGVSNW
ncbi:hypothetical protein HYE67_003724 [Fusarium culmorum]|uniref:Uncharacterized protein n=1 Tax=Fusarium culmorum TaxID=5516 RepID=A0A2T4GJM8_FUSCU|nr:hypothetical protein FCULG_00000879 [Fusarium culmorum]QPC61493.1 hypothetical protein HYE67_003724 [Fusarium culmorum]